MEELSGNSIQIILSIKEGVGFNFVQTPIVVSCSLNGHILESDPVPAGQTSIIDSELVWETEKRAFRSLRLQNVPLKVEIWTIGARGRKERIGYLLLSLLAAKPRPSHKRITVNHSWHKLLGVKPEGKSCNPQMLLRLTVEDACNRSPASVTASSTPTTNKTRNTESVSASSPSHRSQGYIKPNPLLLEKQKLDLPPHLVPSVHNDGSILIGGDTCRDLFQLSLNIQSSENIHLLSDTDGVSLDLKESYYIQWAVFMQTLKTAQGVQNQKVSLTARSSLTALSHYFRESPFAIIKLCSHGKEIGACCVDLRKMIPSVSVPDFVTNFCNDSKTFTCNERCFVVSCVSEEIPCDSNGKKPYLDLEISIRYMNADEKIVSPITDCSTSKNERVILLKDSLVVNENEDSKKQSASNSPLKVIDQNVNLTKRLSIAESNERSTIIVKDNELASKVLKTENDIAAILKQMEILTSASPTKKCSSARDVSEGPPKDDLNVSRSDPCLNHIDRPESQCSHWRKSRSDSMQILALTHNPNVQERERVDLSPRTKERLTVKVVNELEDWKERQQEIFKAQLKQKESSHLELVTKEWEKWRLESELKLNNDLQQCRNLMACLRQTADNIKIQAGHITERENRLRLAKEELELLYNTKYHDLSEASKRMEDDFNHQTKLHQLKYSELEVKLKYFEKANLSLKETIKMQEQEMYALKKCSIPHDRVNEIVQEKSLLEERLQNEIQSKAFFKDQWSASLKEIHTMKLHSQKQLNAQINSDRQELYKVGLEQMLLKEESLLHQDHFALQKLKDDIMSND